MEMPELWSYSRVPNVPEIGSINPGGRPGVFFPGRRAGGAGGPRRTVGHIEKKSPFFDRPAKIAALHDAIDFFNIVLADVALNQVAGDVVEGKTIRIAQTIGVDFRHLACAVKRIAGRDAILSVGADRIKTCRRQGWIERVKPQHFAERGDQVLGVAARHDVTRSDIIGVAAITQREIRVTVRPEGDRAAVMIARVLAERDDLPARSGINDIGVRARDLPLVDDVFVVVGGSSRHRVSRRCVCWYQLAVVGVERLITRAGRVSETGMKSQSEEAAFVIWVGRD